MMLEHNITRDDLEDHQRKIGYGKPFELRQRWQKIVGMAASKLFSCALVEHWGNLGQILGREENVAAAHQLMDYLVEEVQKRYKIALPPELTKSERQEFRRTFKEGAAMTLYQKVDEIIEHEAEYGVEETTSTGTALVVQAKREEMQREVLDELSRQDIKNRKLEVRGGSGTISGVSAGDAININQGVS